MKAGKMRETVTFDDVLLTPQYSEIESRSSIKLEFQMSKVSKLTLPIVSSPMDTVTESSMAQLLDNNGGIGIIHRYNTVEEQVSLVKTSQNAGATNIGAAIGVSGDFSKRAEELYDAGANILCLDIAHGHHILMKRAIAEIRNTLGSSVHIMAGNVATLAGFNDLADWGADSIRVGVGGGSICSTRIVTGHGIPTLQSVLDCSRSDREAMLIADGGIKQTGDVVKAIAAGADMVMLGSMLAGTDESPGETFYVDGVKSKAYRGMASAAAQIDWRGHVASEEGVSHRVTAKGAVSNILKSIEKALRSGMSYTGAKSLSEFRAKADIVKITQASLLESRPHILQG
jgi:IMP dehydrogenase